VCITYRERQGRWRNKEGIDNEKVRNWGKTGRKIGNINMRRR
jgi:hypothetical protein